MISDRFKKIVFGVKVVLFGDYIMGKLEEIIEKFLVDYVMVGGDYDFFLCWFVEYIEEGKDLGIGFVYCGDDGDLVDMGKFFNLDGLLEDLFWMDRDLINVYLYYEKWKKWLLFMWMMVG